MDESILNSVKRQLGLAEDYVPFDAELIMHINGALRILNQLGVGTLGFSITDSTSKWSDFITDAPNLYNEVIPYVAMKVRLVWDPPTIGSVVSALQELVKEYEWRISIQRESDALDEE